MTNLFDKPLFIFEMANNHMGSVDHGLKMIKAFADVSDSFPFQFAFKFQFRALDSFIHPDYRSRGDHAYVKRFSETGLSTDQFRTLKESLVSHRFISICTPFDEPSVDLIVDLDFDIIKIASCSLTDWPLLEKIVETNKPIIASTAGYGLEEIDNIVSFFKHRNKSFVLMHCVGEYPTHESNLQLNQIDLLKKRYQDIPIGFSTHEDPDNQDAIKIAVAKGATVFERHVAFETDEFKKNAYSSTPEQTRIWLQHAQKAYTICGAENTRPRPSAKELSDLCQFKRGVFASQKISMGEKITKDNTFFAFPNMAGQILANDMSKYIDMIAKQEIQLNAPILSEEISATDTREKVYAIVKQIRQLLSNANIVVPGEAQLEISHHFGIDRFHEIGCTIFTVINREYCKKLILMLPGQSHPEQFHKIKEETFLILHGDVTITLDGEIKSLDVGDITTVHREVKHTFSSEHGAVIEEISSTHHCNDSYYSDENIQTNSSRKTILSYWME
jgi:sialic acid synthase SpsE/mannose-6-phosphate isomerase-like protein (cupin superfamily)